VNILISENLNDYMHGFIEKICEEIGPRASGTEAEIRAGNEIEAEMKKFCDETHQEEYISSPHAFLGGIRYGALLVFVAIILYWIDLLIDLNVIPLDQGFGMAFLIFSIALIILTVSYFILEVMKYYEAFDFLFPKKRSKNIIGTINPSERVEKTIIFSAHHDSAFEFNTFYYLKRFGQIIINVGYLAVGIVLIGIVLKFVFELLNLKLSILFLIFGILFLCFSPIIVIYILFHSYKPVLGAFDNLSGVSIVLGIGKYLNEQKGAENFPRKTKVLLISFGGEESGLRGAKRYVEKHYGVLKETGTIIVNMDGIAKKNTLIILDKESGIGAKHDPKIYLPIYEIAKEVNPKAKIAPLPFGATDAAAFSKKGIPAASLGGLDLVSELAPYYHTRFDTPDVVEKEALGQMVELCVKYMKRFEEE
jgi:aminopeptidase YwaD